MSWLDFLIIYFACGTPFAVYRVVLSEAEPGDTAARSIMAALLWPYDGGRAAIKRLLRASRSLSRPRVDVIRVEIEQILANEGPDFRRFEFREVYDRYVALAGASASPGRPFGDLFQIAGTPLTPVSETCLRRISNAKIQLHAAAARNDLLKYITTSSSRRIRDLARFLAADLMDEALSRDLAKLSMTSGETTRPSVTRLSPSASQAR